MCEHCQDGRPLNTVTYSGNGKEPNGHYVIADRKLLIYDDETILRDRIEIRFCPNCGTLLPPEGVVDV